MLQVLCQSGSAMSRRASLRLAPHAPSLGWHALLLLLLFIIIIVITIIVIEYHHHHYYNYND